MAVGIVLLIIKKRPEYAHYLNVRNEKFLFDFSAGQSRALYSVEEKSFRRVWRNNDPAGKCRDDEKLRGKTSLRGNVRGIGSRGPIRKTVFGSDRFMSAVIDRSQPTDTVCTVTVPHISRQRDFFGKSYPQNCFHADDGARFLLNVPEIRRQTLCSTTVLNRSFHTAQVKTGRSGVGPFPISSDGSRKCVSGHYTWSVTDRVSESCREIRYRRRLVETTLFASVQQVCANEQSPELIPDLYRCLV